MKIFLCYGNFSFAFTNPISHSFVMPTVAHLTKRELKLLLDSISVEYLHSATVLTLKSALSQALEDANFTSDYVFDRDNLQFPETIEQEDDPQEEDIADSAETLWFDQWISDNGLPKPVRSCLLESEITTEASLKGFTSTSHSDFADMFSEHLTRPQIGLLRLAIQKFSTVSPPPAATAAPVLTDNFSSPHQLTEGLAQLLGQNKDSFDSAVINSPTTTSSQNMGKNKKPLFILDMLPDIPFSQAPQLLSKTAEGGIYFHSTNATQKKRNLADLSIQEFARAQFKALRRLSENGELLAADDLQGYCKHAESVFGYLVDDQSIKGKVFEYDHNVRLRVHENQAKWGDHHFQVFTETLGSSYFNRVTSRGSVPPQSSFTGRRSFIGPRFQRYAAPSGGGSTDSICRRYNNNQCDRAVSRCEFAHVCSVCGQKHRALECPNKESAGASAPKPFGGQ